MDFIELLQETGLEMTWGTAMLCVAVVLAVTGFYLFKRFVWKHIIQHESNFFVLLYHRFNRPLQLIIILTAITIVVNKLIEDIGDQIWYQKSYSIAVIAIIAWMAVRAIKLMSEWFLGRFNIGVSDNLKARRIHTQIGVLRRLAVSIIILIAIASALMVFDQIRALGVSLIASAGLAGIIIGFAAQKTIGNFFTGFQIAITQPIRIGDVVIVENEWGVIEEINLTYVVVKIWDLRRLVLPITYFVDHPFQNWTRQSANLLGSIMLYLDYAMPLDALRAHFDRVMESEKAKELWDGNVKVIQVTDATDKTMEVRVLVSAAGAGQAFDLRCYVREQLISFIQKNHPEGLPKARGEISSGLFEEAATFS